ncbi:unnamed protein product [Prorocentrum cordatum]|uniref:SRP54-type proteins GTP-binding domain-containing protein n=1 Tax=Prorocentrum cordatum TaxID=2364126 RepID=A0ABN9Y716_9DINO|nr:unnamed protein product [Polarella glacialis]
MWVHCFCSIYIYLCFCLSPFPADNRCLHILPATSSSRRCQVAYYLKNKGGLDVLICACDTFRAGAVEQLKTHARCLDVPLFERGYGKDPAEIAKSAIHHARNNGHEVVLVDTAGRMQDNEPLMRAAQRSATLLLMW